MADKKQAHGAVSEVFADVREYATQKGLALTSFRDFEQALAAMLEDDKQGEGHPKSASPAAHQAQH